MLKKIKLYGWKPCDHNLYNEIYNIYGGSVCSHPQVLSFIKEKADVKINYYFKEHRGEFSGAIFSLNGSLIYNNRSLPFVFDDIVLPVSSDRRLLLPFDTKRLSPLQRKIFVNEIHSKYLKNKIAYVKNEFSVKSVKKREKEFRVFVSAGGTVESVDKFTARELAGIYRDLFKLRWGDSLPMPEFRLLEEVFTIFKHMIFGNVLFMNGTPCAYDLNYIVNHNKRIYIDCYNGGIDPSLKKLGIGSVLLWKNITDAKKMAAEDGGEMIYSLGVYNKAWRYKEQWCDIHSLGRVLL